MTVAADIASALVRCGGVTFRTSPFFVLTSGTESPVYVDNRQMLGHIDERGLIVESLIDLAGALGPFDAIGATATAGIPWGAWIADRLRLPLLYVRAEAKAWGKGRAVEGVAPPDARVLVVEDLAFTAASLRASATNLREAGYRVDHALTILSYRLPDAERTVDAAGLTLTSLASIDDALEAAARQGTLDTEQVATVEEWLSAKRRSQG